MKIGYFVILSPTALGKLVHTVLTFVGYCVMIIEGEICSSEKEYESLCILKSLLGPLMSCDGK